MFFELGEVVRIPDFTIGGKHNSANKLNCEEHCGKQQC